jgi:hypothetical protein
VAVHQRSTVKPGQLSECKVENSLAQLFRQKDGPARRSYAEVVLHGPESLTLMSSSCRCSKLWAGKSGTSSKVSVVPCQILGSSTMKIDKWVEKESWSCRAPDWVPVIDPAISEPWATVLEEHQRKPQIRSLASLFLGEGRGSG